MGLEALNVLPFLTPGAWASRELCAPRPQTLCAPGLSPPHSPRKESGPRNPGLPFCMSHPRTTPVPGPPRHGPTQHRPLPKEPTVLAEASLTAAHLGPGWGGPGRGREASVLLSSDTSCGDWNPRQQRERPLQPPGVGPNPRLLPGKGPSGGPHRLLPVPTITLCQAPGFPPAESGP